MPARAPEAARPQSVCQGKSKTSLATTPANTDAAIAAIEGAHHMVAGDDNGGFLGAILPFLDRVAGKAAA